MKPNHPIKTALLNASESLATPINTTTHPQHTPTPIGAGICDICAKQSDTLFAFDCAPLAGGAICKSCITDAAMRAYSDLIENAEWILPSLPNGQRVELAGCVKRARAALARATQP